MVLLKAEIVTNEHEPVSIAGRRRSATGKGYCRRLRRQGFVPANLLDPAGPTLLEIDGKWLSKAWKNGRKFLLNFEGQERLVRIQELQINPVKRTALHVDLMFV